MSSDADLLRRQLALVDAGHLCATVQIVRVNGSIPNELGARMLVTPPAPDVDHPGVATLVAGTVGGGRIEFEALKLAAIAMAEQRSRLVSAKLTEVEAGGIGMMCGGQADLFIDVHLPAARLVLCGAGHINLALARLAQGLGWRLTVIDDRPEWANLDNFPMLSGSAAALSPAGSPGDLIVARPEHVLESLGLDDRTFVIVGTRENDTESILAASRTKARYIGVVASRRKAIRIIKELAARAAASDPVLADFDLEALLPRFYAPIGLALGGRSPEAVALSILAEVQALRHDQDARPMRVAPEELMRYLEKDSP
jgi:xanthine dehydrogenase accessory factor